MKLLGSSLPVKWRHYTVSGAGPPIVGFTVAENPNASFTTGYYDYPLDENSPPFDIALFDDLSGFGASLEV